MCSLSLLSIQLILCLVLREGTDDTIDSEVRNNAGQKRMSWVDHVFRPGIDIERTPFFILGTSGDDKSSIPHVLTPPLMQALHKQLPMSCAESNFWLKYSLVRDGASFEVFEAKIAMSKNTILAIETLEGDVFGCFMAKPWTRTNKYEMSGESFLWRMKHQRSTPKTGEGQGALKNDETLDEIAERESDVEIFRWTGENDLCQLFSNNRIAAGGGGGFGFIVEDELSNGNSSPCMTYGNTCLVSSQDGRFEVANMEVWCMTPFLFAEEAEKSETTLRFIQGNMMVNAHGDAPSSAQSAWTNFL